MKFSSLRAALARPHQAVAENVLLGDDERGPSVSKPVSSPSTASADRRCAAVAGACAPDSPTSAGCAARGRPSTCAMRSREPSTTARGSTRLRRPAAPAICATTASKTLTVGVGALGRETAPVPRAGIDRRCASSVGHRERRQRGQRRFVQPLRPFGRRADRAGPAAAACRARRPPALLQRLAGGRRNSP